jgi:hypothetical protein
MAEYLIAATDKGIFVSDTSFQYQQSLSASNKRNFQVSFSTTRLLNDNIFVRASDGLYQIKQEKTSFKLGRPSFYKFFRGLLSEPLDDIYMAGENLFWLIASNGNVVCLNTKTGDTDMVYLAPIIAMKKELDRIKQKFLRIFKNEFTWLRKMEYLSTTGTIIADANK